MPGMQCQGRPGEPGLLHSPVPPSLTPSGEKSPPSRAALGAGIEPVPLPAAAPREPGRAAGTGGSGAAWALPPVPCRRRSRDRAPRERLCPSAASWQRPRRGAPPERENIKPGGGFPSCGKGRRGGGFVVICGGFVCTEIPSAASRASPAAALAGLRAHQLLEAFPSRSLSQARSDPGRRDATALLGKPRAPAGAVSRGASLESWLLERAWEGAALRFHLCPRA